MHIWTPIQTLREEAAYHAGCREDCFQNANKAYTRGRSAEAKEYANDGRRHAEQLREANMEAAEEILKDR